MSAIDFRTVLQEYNCGSVEELGDLLEKQGKSSIMVKTICSKGFIQEKEIPISQLKFGGIGGNTSDHDKFLDKIEAQGRDVCTTIAVVDKSVEPAQDIVPETIS